MVQAQAQEGPTLATREAGPRCRAENDRSRNASVHTRGVGLAAFRRPLGALTGAPIAGLPYGMSSPIASASSCMTSESSSSCSQLTWPPATGRRYPPRPDGCHVGPRPKKPRVRGFLSAPERTRTSTDHSVHKALNQVRAAWMHPAASRSPKPGRLWDALDAAETMDVVTAVVAPGSRRVSRRAGPGQAEHRRDGTRATRYRCCGCCGLRNARGSPTVRRVVGWLL